ncbi:nuclear transport factor 2 family protein [Cellulomonas edaphi]|uniref:Nuclear transport factor 2 family protein n=1 Tax=Cellulomonas edaphi TaxID=3053468 RepID=A0ABT7SA01_9CELL|nr:nuclear transport factor 2 family protein [Cellulomons edaphi]MDM7831862.1 nuclear transport factor 2 family protein [Cellulomons edaphi]
MTTPDPLEFAAAWVAAWNAHDLEAVLSHFREDVVFTSPVATRVVPDSGGVIRGKGALRAYWTRGLELIPDLRFSVERVFAGVDVLVISYRNQRGALVDEVLVFRDGLVIEGHGTYLTGDDNPAGVVDAA